MKNKFLEFLKENLTALQFENLAAKLDLSPRGLTFIIEGKTELTARQLETLSLLTNKRMEVVFQAYDRATRKIVALQKTQAA